MHLHLKPMKISSKDIENTNTEERTHTHKREHTPVPSDCAQVSLHVSSMAACVTERKHTGRRPRAEQSQTKRENLQHFQFNAKPVHAACLSLVFRFGVSNFGMLGPGCCIASLYVPAAAIDLWPTKQSLKA